MPKLPRDTAPQVLATEAMEIRSGARLAHHVAFECFREEARTDGHARSQEVVQRNFRH